MLDIPIKELKSRGQMLSDAIKEIQNKYPDWTDLSPHDPGMTLLELLVELQARQQEVINNQASKNRQQYLELLNFYPQPAQCATTEVVFSSSKGNTILPARTRLKAQDIIFETNDKMVITNNRLQLLALKDNNDNILDRREAQELWEREWAVFRCCRFRL